MGALPGVGTAVEVTLDLLEGALDRLLQLGVKDLEPESMRAYVRRTRVAINRLEFVSGRALVAFDACGGPATVGEPSSVSWLKNECRLDPGAAAERVLVARQMEIRADTALLLSRGVIGYDDAAVVARSVVEVRPEDAPTVERRVLALASGMDPGRLRHSAKQVVAEVDHEALLRDSRRAYERRAMRIGPDRNGNVKVEATLTSECAAYLRLVVNAHIGPAGRDDDRTMVQRRHDAFQTGLKGLASDGSTPTVPGARPHITVVAPLSAVLGEDGPPALLQGLVPIPPETLARIACDASLSAVIEDADGKPIYSGPRVRTFSARQRRALAAKQMTCSWPNCDRPAEWCDGHHVVPYADGGATTLRNGELECSFHHPLLHEGGWSLVPGANGMRRALPPGHPENPRLVGDDRRAWARSMWERWEDKRRRLGGPTADLAGPSPPG